LGKHLTGKKSEISGKGNRRVCEKRVVEGEGLRGHNAPQGVAQRTRGRVWCLAGICKSREKQSWAVKKGGGLRSQK